MKQRGVGWLKKLMREDVGLAYVTIGSLGSSFLGASFWFILASMLEVENYGVVNYDIALASIFATIGTLGLNTTVTTYLARGEKDIVHEANSVTLISGLVLAFMLSAFQWSPGILSPTIIFFGMTLAEILGGRMYREYTFLSIGQRIAQISLSILFYLQLGISGIIIGYFVSFLASSYRYLRSTRNFTLKINNLKEKRNFTLHSYGFSLIRNLSTQLDKVIVGSLFGYYALGLYQLGYQFLMFLGIIPGSLYQYLLPEESSGEDKTDVKLAGIAFSVAASLLFFALSPHLINTLFPTFTDSIQVVEIMSLAVVPSAIANMLAASLLGKGRSKTVFTAGLLYLASLVTGLIVMGKIMGILGLALTLVIAQTVQATYLTVAKARKSLSLMNVWG